MKGRGFESLQERRERFLLQCRLSVLTLISVSVPPRATAVARKRSRSFCQKCRWQVTAKYACTLPIIMALHEVTWCMVVWCTQNLRRDGCSFMWHQPCQRCKYTTSVDINNTRCIQSLIQNHMRHVRTESAREQRIALYKSYE